MWKICPNRSGYDIPVRVPSDSNPLLEKRHACPPVRSTLESRPFLWSDRLGALQIISRLARSYGLYDFNRIFFSVLRDRLTGVKITYIDELASAFDHLGNRFWRNIHQVYRLGREQSGMSRDATMATIMILLQNDLTS